MYKRILVPVDGSPTSLSGLQEAIRLAKDQGASLRLVHVVDEFLMDSPYAPSFDYQAFLTALRAGGNSILENARAMAREQGGQKLRAASQHPYIVERYRGTPMAGTDHDRSVR